jgi:hypothetical protein
MVIQDCWFVLSAESTWVAGAWPERSDWFASEDWSGLVMSLGLCLCLGFVDGTD